MNISGLRMNVTSETASGWYITEIKNRIGQKQAVLNKVKNNLCNKFPLLEVTERLASTSHVGSGALCVRERKD